MATRVEGYTWDKCTEWENMRIETMGKKWSKFAETQVLRLKCYVLGGVALNFKYQTDHYNRGASWLFSRIVAGYIFLAPRTENIHRNLKCWKESSPL
jgi:hypothetical protein